MATPFSIGQVIGHFTVLECLGTIRRKRRVRVRCSCGNERVLAEDDIRSGTTKSCGHLRRERASALNRTHGQAGRNRTRLYRTWEAMWDRTGRKDKYIERGIVVSPEWERFEPFRDYILATIGEPPVGQTLDRIDNDRGYEPGNVRWATPAVQQQNTSVTIHITVDGVTKPLVEWARMLGAQPQVIHKRIAAGWEPSKAATTPVRRISRT